MSLLAEEIAEIPAATARLLRDGAADVAGVASGLRGRDVRLLATVARGSSDHVATMLSYGVGLGSDLMVASYPPSLATLHGQVPAAEGAVAFAISQSGRSPDIVAAAGALARGGAHLLVLTNRVDGPLARGGGRVVDIRAGPERAVAATKSFVNSVVAGAMILAEWREDVALSRALRALPEALGDARARDVSALQGFFEAAGQLIVLGRGPSFGAASEAALKAMELCGILAVAYSTAEVRHGPMQVIRDGFPVLDLARGTPLEGARPGPLPPAAGLHPLLDPLVDLVAIYRALEGAARARGLNPDAPDRLCKETITF